MKKTLFILGLLIVSILSYGQHLSTGAGKRAVGGAGAIIKNKKPETVIGNGSGVLLWYTDFNDMATTSNIVNAHIDTAWGDSDDRGPWGFNDGDDITDGGDGEKYMQWWMDNGGTGGAAGKQVEKSLDDYQTYDSRLDNMTEVWISATIEIESSFAEEASGKMGVGAGTKDRYTDYGGGFHLTTTYDSDEYLKAQLYWYGMPTSSGQQLVFYNTYPSTGSIPVGNDTFNVTIHVHLPENPPDSTDGYVELYYNEVLRARYDTLSLRMNDSLDIDFAKCRWFPSSTDPTNSDWWMKVYNWAMWTETAGDSTWVGMKWLNEGHEDSIITIDVPGWPVGEDTTSWGDYGDTEQGSPPTASRAYNVLWYQDFSDWYQSVPDNNLSGDDVDSLFGGPNRLAQGFGSFYNGRWHYNANIQIVDGDTVLRGEAENDSAGSHYSYSTNFYLRGQKGNFGDTLGGHEELWYGYNYEFDSRWNQYTESSGKLPGGFVATEEAFQHSGGKGAPDDGLFLRTAWGDEKVFRFYLYWHDQPDPNDYGEVSLNWEYPEGSGTDVNFIDSYRENHLAARVVLDSPAAANNGYIQGFIDGKLCLTWDNLDLRSHDSVKFDYFAWPYFWGGNAVTARPTVDGTWLDIKDIYIWNYPDTDSTLTGQEKADTSMNFLFPGM